jgi:hypothetical protein
MTQLLPALRAAFGSRPITALDVAATAYSGDAGLRAALFATGMRTFSAANIGKKLATLVRDGLLLLEPWKGGRRYRIADALTARGA